MRKHPILKTIYFDNGCVFRSSSQTQLQYLINIIDETSIAQSITLKVEYTDLSTSIANIKTDDLIIGATGNYQSFSKTGKFIFPNPVQIDKIVLVTTCTDATVKNYEQICGTNFTIGTGKTMQIQARTNVANITSSSSSVGKELIAVYYPKDITFESSNFGDGRIVVDYTHGGTQPYTYEYFLKDHQGSTRMVINDQGSITEAVMYQPYGTMLDVPGGVVSPIPVREKYTGKEFDFDGAINGAPGINLLYFGARSYDPDIGVWTSADPAEQYWNLYSYCGGNPVVLVDPDGQWAAALIFGLFELAVNYLVHSIASGDWDPTSNNTFSNTTFSAGYSYGTGPGSPEGVYIGINDGRVYPGWSERTDNGSSTTITLRNNYNVDLGLQLLIDNKGVNEYIKDFYIKSYEPLLVASNDLKIKTEYDCGIGGGDIATDAIDMQLYLSASNSGSIPTLHQLYGEAIAITPVEWVNNVREGGKWDFKAHYGPSYEPYGNLAYGVTGTAQGIPKSILLRAAGAVQKLTKTSSSTWGQPWGASPFGDDPRDQAQIVKGIEWANSLRLFLPNAPFAPDATRTR
jgi:RHS repeat-associated protein